MTEKQINAGLRRIEAAVKRAELAVSSAHKEATTFVAVDRVIMLGSYCVARAKSKTYAVRIANALNRYTPDDRGR